MATLRQITKTKYPNDFKDAFDIAHWTCCDLNHVFFAVLRALASSRRKIESLSVTPGFGLESQYNTPDVLLIVPFFDSSDDPEPMPVLDGYLGVRLRPALDNLHSLRLVVSWVPSTDGDDPYYEMNWLPQFVNVAPQLEHLAIRQSDFTTAGLSAFWDQVHMPRLKTVEFVHGVAVSETMQKFLKRHSTTLTEMSLEYFSSSPGSWTDILPTLLEVSVASEITLKVEWLIETTDGWPHDHKLIVFDTDGREEVCNECINNGSPGQTYPHKREWTSRTFASAHVNSHIHFKVANMLQYQSRVSRPPRRWVVGNARVTTTPLFVDVEIASESESGQD